MNRILMIYNVLSDARKAGVGGDGRVSEEIGTNINNHSECQRIKYKSESRILLVGSGADEQSAGYGPIKLITNKAGQDGSAGLIQNSFVQN
ncbi:hypothetical protein HanPSC8_Chr03g0094961 [Helianthus annuus]|nr:hypothetical protein HanPSC8_Chr03g0094961 [Helianthus annuus]